MRAHTGTWKTSENTKQKCMISESAESKPLSLSEVLQLLGQLHLGGGEDFHLTPVKHSSGL